MVCCSNAYAFTTMVVIRVNCILKGHMFLYLIMHQRLILRIDKGSCSVILVAARPWISSSFYVLYIRLVKHYKDKHFLCMMI